MMRVLLALLFALLAFFLIVSASGCVATTSPLVKLDLDERLLVPCQKELPRLKSTEDTEVLEWSKQMTLIYVRCSEQDGAKSDFIRRYNTRVDEANAKIKEIAR